MLAGNEQYGMDWSCYMGKGKAKDKMLVRDLNQQVMFCYFLVGMAVRMVKRNFVVNPSSWDHDVADIIWSLVLDLHKLSCALAGHSDFDILSFLTRVLILSKKYINWERRN